MTPGAQRRPRCHYLKGSRGQETIHGAWKYALEQYFAPFLALFFPEAHAAIDWSQPVAFRDTELQQIAPEDQAGKRRVDKLVQVRRLDGEPAALALTRNPFATLALLHRDAQETRGNPAERVRRKATRYRALLQQGYTAPDVRALLRLMEHVLRLDAEHALQARATMRQVEVEETGMDTFVTSIEEIGRAEGQLEERRAIVLRLLNRKVGPLTEELHTRVSALPPELLLALSEALLDFTAQTDLVSWLDANGDKQTA